MDRNGLKKFLLMWHGKHGKPNDLTEPKVVVKGKTFLFTKAIETDGYPTVFGYALEANKLYCRHFYKSCSEAAWRVGSGFRHGGGWVKGAEKVATDKHGKLPTGVPKLADKNLHHGGGYIFEGMVSLLLDSKLEKYYTTTTRETLFHTGSTTQLNSLGDAVKNALKTAKSTPETALQKFLINPSGPNQISVEYAQQRDWVFVLPTDKNVFDPSDKKTPLNVLGSTKHQEHSYRKSDVKTFSDSAQILKKATALWEIINPCLKAEQSGDEYSYKTHHDTLNEEITIRTYLLNLNSKHVYVQLAESEKKQRQFKTNLGVDCTIQSPICWVRAIYVGDALSSFGNYLEYPKDLCFLVQKPLDYLKQTSEFLAKRSDVQTITDHHGELKFSPLQYDHDNPNILKKGEAHKNTYLLLALFDEKYSPLIQQYKKARGYEMYKWKSEKYAKYTLEEFNRGAARIAPMLYLFVLQSCEDYLGMTMAEKRKDHGTHGAAGIDRVRLFRALIEERIQPDNIKELNRVIYDLFYHGKVGGKSVYSIFSTLRTNTNSFFSFFCRSILKPFFLEDLVSKDSGHNTSKLKGAEHAIARMYFRAVEMGLDAASLQHLTAEQSASLLAALKAG